MPTTVLNCHTGYDSIQTDVGTVANRADPPNSAEAIAEWMNIA